MDGPTLGLLGSEGSVTGGWDCIVPEEVLYSSAVPPWFVLHPLTMAAAHTVDNNNAIFMQ
jgi:hypothetical protein